MCSEAFRVKNRYDQFWAQKHVNSINSHILNVYQYFSTIFILKTRDKTGKWVEYEKRTHFWCITYKGCGSILGQKCILKTTIATYLKWLSLERAVKNMQICHNAKVCRMNSLRYLAKSNFESCTFSCKMANTHQGFFDFAKKLLELFAWEWQNLNGKGVLAFRFCC